MLMGWHSVDYDLASDDVSPLNMQGRQGSRYCV